ncbi:GNAT family N-acetyltransferase [Bordetella bronchiseptica]|uniref:GNAT family N-acetyltransferase n=1 Tax=Bordetella bronchiseptica TaxID=518 RepID=UPI00126832B3|nr:GNAT family N-acetyltransferase [Bordetella bronchiseptica]
MITFDAEVVGPWVASRVGKPYVPGTCSAIGRVVNGKIVAGVLYEEFNGTNVFCHIAGDGRGWLSRNFLSIIFDYPFRQLKVKRITGVVASSNEAARKFDEHLGFELEAILLGAHPDGDLLVYKMTADKCRWLKDLPYEHVCKSGNS